MNKQLLIFLLVMGLIVAGLIYYHFNREQVVYSNVFFGALPSATPLPAGQAIGVNVNTGTGQNTLPGQQAEITPGAD